MNVIRGITCAVTLAASMATVNAYSSGNVLSDPGFEGLTGLDAYWASAAGVWGGENVALSSGSAGVSPLSGSQMLQINHAGGGTAAQAHQIVYGPFEAGSTVTFEAPFNTPHSGIQVGLILETRSSLTSVTTRSANTSFTLDSDTSTWESFEVSIVLAADTDYIAAELVIWHGSIPGAIGTLGGFVDDAVLTVTPLVVDTDQDGVPDSDDACANSILTSTVSVADLDTGVVNYVDAQGCSVADSLAIACSGDFRNHGQFVSCVAHAVEDLVLNGLLTEEEADAIVSTAAQSDVGKKAKPSNRGGR